MKSLTGDLGLKVGPLVLEVLVKHWFDRLKRDCAVDDNRVDLKEDNILYHEVFVIVRELLNAATSHTVEEMQSFSNMRVPSPPWVHVVRTSVPLSCCDEAAPYLIKALGGEDVARKVVGGVKWWQVRGVSGVDAQWITMKKDWREAKKRHKAQAQMGLNSPTSPPPESSRSGDNGIYNKDMDAMRCILYLHGGAYYFGSIDQTRYSTQRFARKINGRVFAINYRLAPQYPFPCGLHDALAAYLFLIRPPPGSDHVAVKPAHIIISGDSAGGGLSLALLQVIRDSGLPSPAGGVLISPWCDLTHSFPSVRQNTKSDVIPECGLLFHKPSILWPPPSPDILKDVHASLRFRIKQAFGLGDSAGISQTSTIRSEKDIPHRLAPFDSHPFDSPSSSAGPDSKKKIPTGEDAEIMGQLQFYTTNILLKHPLVSPVTGYLGGLPPLLFIAGDEEVLRDEIIHTAHKAAYPEKYPILSSSLLLCPHLQDVEKRENKPTSVHLQVYDGTPHILPLLFPFTTPAKFCFRAIANFDRFVTDMKMTPPLMTTNQFGPSSGRPSLSYRRSLFSSYRSGESRTEPNENVSHIVDDAPLVLSPPRMDSSILPVAPHAPHRQSSFQHIFSARMTQAGSLLRQRHSIFSQEGREDQIRSDNKQAPNGSSGATGHEFQASRQMVEKSSERMAGECQVYEDIKDRVNWECRMIRERVSTSGIIRSLEPEEELPACKMPRDRVAQLSEDAVRQYIKDKRKFDQQFDHTVKSIEKNRQNNLAKAKKDTIKRAIALHQSINRKEEDRDNVNVESLEPNRTQSRLIFDQRVLSSPGWAWSWVLDELENPPPSSIVARRDTEEARQLAATADWATRDETHALSGNNLWNVVQNFLTAAPTNGYKHRVLHKPHRKQEDRRGT